MLQFRNDQFSRIEQTAIQTICLQQPAVIAKLLIKQFTSALLKTRNITDSGAFIYIDVPLECDPVDETLHIIGNLQMKLSELTFHCNCILFLKQGYLNVLEFATQQEKWPDNISHFEIVHA
jgi:hypothetical protein